jgi:hypothetical protein
MMRRIISIFLVSITAGCLSNSPQDTNIGTAYYIDASGGNDLNDGYSPETPWKTISQVNDKTIMPGSRVLFKRGEKWILSVGEVIIGQSNVTYSAYGSGALPIIDGNHVADVFQAIDRENITLLELDLRNGLNSNSQFLRSRNINVINCEMSGAGNDNLVFIDNNSVVRVTGGKYFNPIRTVKSAIISNIEIADGGNDFIIDGVELYGAENAGITIHNHSGYDAHPRTDVPTDIYIRNIYSHDNAGFGINILSQDQTAPVSISITNSFFIRNDTGIRIQKAFSASSYLHGNILVDQCKTIDNSTYSFFVEADDVTIQRSLFSGTDQQGHLIDGKNNNILNNTFSANPSDPIWLLFIRGMGRVESITIRNNIFYLGLFSDHIVGTGKNSTSNVIFDNNEYFISNYQSQPSWFWDGNAYTFDNWVGVISQDIHSLGPSVDPLFTNPAEGDYSLQRTSPAIHQGADVGLPFIGTAPDLGAFPSLVP